jgi:hypothetical protein
MACTTWKGGVFMSSIPVYIDVTELRDHERKLMQLEVLCFQLSPDPERTSIFQTLQGITDEWATVILRERLQARLDGENGGAAC